MPVLEAKDSIAPRSVLRHRPIGEDSTSTRAGRRAGGTTTTAAITPVVQRASRSKSHPTPADTQVQDDIAEWQRIEARETDKEDEPTTEPPAPTARRAS